MKFDLLTGGQAIKVYLCGILGFLGRYFVFLVHISFLCFSCFKIIFF